MLAKQITYTDPFTDEKITKTFYFNLTKAELLELEKSRKGGFSDLLKKIIEEKDNEKLIPYFKEIISMSYGVRTDSGSFKKTKEDTEEFMASEAYSELFWSFFDDGVLAQFVNGIMPKELMAEVNKQFPGGFKDSESMIKSLNLAGGDANAKENNSTT